MERRGGMEVYIFAKAPATLPQGKSARYVGQEAGWVHSGSSCRGGEAKNPCWESNPNRPAYSLPITV
jgi:hypothetical protein